MASANLQSKISLDDSNFKAGMRRVQTSAKTGMAAVRRSAERVGRSMAQLGGKIKRVGMIIGAITFAGAIAGAAAFARGIKGAIDAGGALSDLSSRTGIAVSQLVVLQQAFKDNGLAAEKVGTVINKMQKGITDLGNGLSTQVRAFDSLGISFEDIARLSPADQFKAIQKAISGIEDPTKKAGIAMDIFGRAGGELLTLFSDKGAMTNAAQTIGTQAQLLEENAELFDSISDKLGNAGVKIQGFFVGIADVFAPQILATLESINKLDFAQFGQNLAKSIEGGKLKDILNDALAVGVAAFRDGMVNAVVQSTAILKKLLSEEGLFELKAFNSSLSDEAKDRIGERMKGESDSDYEKRKKTDEATFDKLDKMRGDRFSKFLQETLDSLPKLDFSSTKAAVDKLTGGIGETNKPDPSGSGGRGGILGWRERRKKMESEQAKELENWKESQKPKAGFMAGLISSGLKALKNTKAPEEKEKSGGNFLAGLMQAGMQAMKNVTGSKTLGESAYRMEAADHRQAGFSGLGGLAQMQADRLSGIGPGENSIFAQDRKRLGIKSGLSITGLNEVKKAKDKEGVKGDRVGSSLVDVNVKLNKANGYYEEMITKLDEGLAS